MLRQIAAFTSTAAVPPECFVLGDLFDVCLIVTIPRDLGRRTWHSSMKMSEERHNPCDARVKKYDVICPERYLLYLVSRLDVLRAQDVSSLSHYEYLVKDHRSARIYTSNPTSKAQDMPLPPPQPAGKPVKPPTPTPAKPKSKV